MTVSLINEDVQLWQCTLEMVDLFDHFMLPFQTDPSELYLPRPCP